MAVGGSTVKTLTIGSRGSQLALWQARSVSSQLRQLGIGSRIEIIKTTGDRLDTASLVQSGGKGLFTKEIEEALLAGAIDVAVHSLKDLPTETPRGLAIAATPPREDARDAIVGWAFKDLPERARIGTSSERRKAQLRLLRPDLQFEPIRGNVDTRLRKLKDGCYDALVLAAAGLKRLGLQNEIAEILSPELVCPAAGQGALAIQTREDDAVRDVCAELNDDATSRAVACERMILRALGGGCQLPLGALAELLDGVLRAMAVVVSPDGSRALRANADGSPNDPERVGWAVADELLRSGARTILSESS
jgi:hydroxymethylbilane synthase